MVEVPPVTDHHRYRRIVVSPEVNTPPPFRGFGGFCGWPRIQALADGDLLVAFSAGYWHASWPTPLERFEPPEYAAGLYSRVGDWLQSWDAPDGGRMMWTRSSDGGRLVERTALLSGGGPGPTPSAPCCSAATARCWPSPWRSSGTATAR